MKLVNSRGRVLLHVTSADADLVPAPNGGLMFANTLYTYKGEGMGGYTDLVNLHRTIACVTSDNPSAKLEGLLPEPTIRTRQ
jgi:hypothetical protein